MSNDCGAERRNVICVLLATVLLALASVSSGCKSCQPQPSQPQQDPGNLHPFIGTPDPHPIDLQSNKYKKGIIIARWKPEGYGDYTVEVRKGSATGTIIWTAHSAVDDVKVKVIDVTDIDTVQNLYVQVLRGGTAITSEKTKTDSTDNVAGTKFTTWVTFREEQSTRTIFTTPIGLTLRVTD